MKTLRELAEKIRGTKPYENLHSILGDEMGSLIYSLVEESIRSDKEIDILHDAMMELYEHDYSYPVVKKCLDRIDYLRKRK